MTPFLPLLEVFGAIVLELIKGKNERLRTRFEDGFKFRLDKIRELSQSVYPNYSSDRLLRAYQELNDYLSAYKKLIDSDSSVNLP